MTSFIDGPAKGQGLALQRSPFFLRVVVNSLTEQWDALDQPEDTPKDEEIIFAYQLAETPGVCHIKHRDPKQSGFQSMAIYKVVAEPPVEKVLRTTARWHAWCEEHADESKAVFDSLKPRTKLPAAEAKAPVYIYREKTNPDGAKVQVREIYTPPNFPPRPYRMQHKATGRWLIVTPGGWQTEQKANLRSDGTPQMIDAKGRAKAPTVDEDEKKSGAKWDGHDRTEDEPCHPQPFRWLRDRMHATPLAGPEEAKSLAAEWDRIFDDYERKTKKSMARFRLHPGEQILTKQ